MWVGVVVVSGWCLVGLVCRGCGGVSGQLSLIDLEGAAGGVSGRVVGGGLAGETAKPRYLRGGSCPRGLEREIAGLLGDGLGRTTAEISLQLRVRKQAVTDALKASPRLFRREPGGPRGRKHKRCCGSSQTTLLRYDRRSREAAGAVPGSGGQHL